MTKVNKPTSWANEINSTKILHKIWSNPVITDLINETSWKTDILIDDKMNILSQAEINALDKGFIKMILDLKQKMINLIGRKLDKLDLDSPILKRVDEFVNWVINNIPWYELDYTMWNIIIWLPVVKWKKFWDFPRPYSAIDLFQDNIKELEAMPDLMKNIDKNWPKLSAKVKKLDNQIMNELGKKFISTEELLNYYNPIRENYYAKIKEKYPDSWKYFAWHALISSTTIEWVSFYIDFPWEDSVITFQEDCLREFKKMPNILKNQEKNRKSLHRKISNKRKSVINLAIEKLWKTDSWLWWQVLKFEWYCNFMKGKYGKNLLNYYSWHAIIWSTPREWWPHKFIDIVWQDSVMSFLDLCINELENITKEDIKIIHKKIKILSKIRKPNFSSNEVEELKKLLPKMTSFNVDKMIDLYKNIATLRNNLGEISKELLWEIWGLYWWYKRTSSYFEKIQRKYPNYTEYIVWPFVIWGTPTEWEAKYSNDFPEPDSAMTFFENCKNELLYMDKEQLNFYNWLTAEKLKTLHKL